MKVAQCDDNRYYIEETDDFNQGLPHNAFPHLPLKETPDQPEPSWGWWKDGYWPRISLDWTKWEFVEDHRGETYYDGLVPIIIETLGPVPSNYTLEPFETQLQIDLELKKLKEEKKKEIDDTRVVMWNQGVLYKGHVFQSTTKSIDDVTRTFNGVSKLGWEICCGEGYTWRSQADIYVPFNEFDLQMLYAILVVQNEVVYNVGWREKQLIDSYTTRADVKALKPTMLDIYQIDYLMTEKIEKIKEALMSR